MRAVRFERFGGPEVLQVVDVAEPEPGPGEVRVRVRAAGINPGESKIREGQLEAMWPTRLPCGEGSDLAGVVDAVGSGVDRPGVGDEVVGWSDRRSSHAEAVVVPADQVTPKPPGVPWEVAGGLYVAGVTGVATVRAVRASTGDTVVVAGAAGAVGLVAAQLAVAAGARVLGVAGERNHGWLRSKGIEPVAYGDGVEERLRAAGPVHALIDAVGGGYVDLAVALGVAPERIDSVADFEAAGRVGAKTEGAAAASSAGTLADLLGRLDRGELELPVDRTFPLDRVAEAFRHLEDGHGRGKVVLIP